MNPHARTVLGVMVVSALLAGCAQKPPAPSVAAAAPPVTVKTCAHDSWCNVNVVVKQDASGTPIAVLEWDEVRMLKALPGTILLWQLYASPDYEFRPGSIIATTNAPLAPSQFDVRQVSPTQFALGDLNRDSNTYTYEVRVYRKGAPDTAPLVDRGTVVNVAN